jgi:hypothetical protein
VSARTAGVPPATPGTKAPVRASERRWPMPPRLATAFLIATLFHLSMVTVFRIVVVFPETKAKYCQIQIFSEAPPAPETAAPPRTGGGELILRRPLLLAQAPETRVELPTMNFGELERLRVRSEAGTDPAALNRGFEPTGSWAGFAGGLQNIGLKLRELVFPGEQVAPENTRHPVAKHHPAPGYSGEIVWDAAPRDRELLFAPPIGALADTANAGLRWPVEIVLTVSPAGRVVNVWCAAVDEAGVIDAVQRAALQYRFAPLPADTVAETGTAAAKQMATLFIRPADEQP